MINRPFVVVWEILVRVTLLLCHPLFSASMVKQLIQTNLGSDHRAVRGHLQVHAFKSYIKDTKKKIKKWRPVLEEGVAKNYLSAMHPKIKDEDYSIGKLQNILLDAAYTEGVQKSTVIPKKPWQSIDFSI